MAPGSTTEFRCGCRAYSDGTPVGGAIVGAPGATGPGVVNTGMPFSTGAPSVVAHGSQGFTG
jgi:hypothetical protein